MQLDNLMRSAIESTGHITEKNNLKVFKGVDYNYVFNRLNGVFIRYGETTKDDPVMSVYGPEILDIEVSTVCHNNCPFCYKTNTCVGENMSLSTFKYIINKLPKYDRHFFLTQIAFGIGSIDANPDLFNMMAFCRRKGIVPNITINGSRMTKKYYDLLVKHCGAVAVSHYDDETCFNAVTELTTRGLKQVNIHSLLSEETYDKCLKLLDKVKIDGRLSQLNAVVFLWLKPKGDRNVYHQITNLKKLRAIYDKAVSLGINIGFDSCSASNFLHSIKDIKNFESIKQMVDPCESARFSAYCNVKGEFFPCSFSEGCTHWQEGIKLNKSFMKDVWFNKKWLMFREGNITNGCNCILYNLELK
jgi:MoaA/NifB/PqqE/SkfB family radical SAM enzyme